VPGCGQGAESLDLSWRLLEKLKREQLEAVWERLCVENVNPGDIDLNREGRKMLLSFADKAHLSLYQDGAARTVWTVSRPGNVQLLRFVKRADGSFVMIADETGLVSLHHTDDGRLVHEFELKGGALAQIALNGPVLTYLCQDGALGQVNLTDGSHFFRQDGIEELCLFAPWQRDKLLVTTTSNFGILDLSRAGSDLQPLRLGLEFTKIPCFAKPLPEWGVLALSFNSGKLRILGVNGGGVLATLEHGDENVVTALELLPALGIALTTTASGQIFLWDLRTQEPLEEFLAHRGGVSKLRTSRGGRYLLTSGQDGIIRCWETSWSAGELRTGGTGDTGVPWLALGKSAARLH
jgi:hypothetical protein